MQNLTKYECTRVIALRALEIQNGSQHLIDIEDQALQTNNMFVAAMELKKGLLDFKINRKYPMDIVQQVHSINYTVHPDVDVLINTIKSKVS